MAKRGIDVSSHNGNINWGAVKNGGIEFAILRVGYGMYLNQKDAQFENYYQGATSVGIPVGAYLYSYAKNVAEAEREADCAIKWLNGRKLNLPVYFDIEDPSQEKLGRETLDAMCRAFCNKIEQAGYPAGIYASKYWSTSVISGAELGQRYTYWVAQYYNQCTYNGPYAIWQDSGSGRVPGINGDVDTDWMYQDIIDGKTPAPVPTPTGCTGDITYRVYDNAKGCYLPSVVNDRDCAGNRGNTIGGIKAKCPNGNIYIQSHIIGKPESQWEETVTLNPSNYNSNAADAYSGILGKNIDCVKVWSDFGYVLYRVSPVNENYLPWVDSRNRNNGTANSYAGIYGKPIDRIQMK